MLNSDLPAEFFWINALLFDTGNNNATPRPNSHCSLRLRPHNRSQHSDPQGRREGDATATGTPAAAVAVQCLKEADQPVMRADCD
jgi:hypothetical protein